MDAVVRTCVEAIAAVRAVRLIRPRAHVAGPAACIAVGTGIGLVDPEKGKRLNSSRTPPKGQAKRHHAAEIMIPAARKTSTRDVRNSHRSEAWSNVRPMEAQNPPHTNGDIRPGLSHDEPGPQGDYEHQIFAVGEHLPAFFRQFEGGEFAHNAIGQPLPGRSSRRMRGRKRRR